jgi:hypothetical protein
MEVRKKICDHCDLEIKPGDVCFSLSAEVGRVQPPLRRIKRHPEIGYRDLDLCAMCALHSTITRDALKETFEELEPKQGPPFQIGQVVRWSDRTDLVVTEFKWSTDHWKVKVRAPDFATTIEAPAAAFFDDGEVRFCNEGNNE